VQKNMTVSGEHDSDSFNFMDVAMKNVGAGQSLTKLGCYYFFKRCDENKEVDEKFVVGVEPGIKGNSDDISIITSEDPTTLSSQKKRAYSAIAELNDVAKTIAEQMKESNRLVQISTDEMKEKNRLVQQSNLEKKKKNHLAEQSNIISLATTLGNRELLQTLLGSMVSSATNPSSEDPMRSSSSSES
jgi:FtsZ-binding cell division protein ZapB